ncbi:hypothetical protein AZF37_06275 [endosymbiont 'TC1' of Trimyema compressum]|uniref:PqqD family protein n=1 Tax=endosymbiont 'TC1' of Trimyema compressum TaxID=243899 RepID=UPI0007F09BB2|nr:PqqD family protein [endosymbiont 'TC1' of Trimyema compressum]AMP20830.1 hypothetical protein AZF37_06275 [endosymbiont 'TC1' of Trimyema compressum]
MKYNPKHNFLSYVPVIIHKDYQLVEDHIILYFHYKQPIQRFFTWLFKKPTTTDITLDDNSTRVWLLINGKRSVYDIAKIMAEDLRDSEEVAIARLIPFMRHILKQRYIKLDHIKEERDWDEF